MPLNQAGRFTFENDRAEAAAAARAAAVPAAEAAPEPVAEVPAEPDPAAARPKPAPKAAG